MKNIITTTIFLLSSLFLSGQDLETDTAWIESESKALFKDSEELLNIVYYHLEFDYLIENLDTLSEKNKIKREIYQEQKEELITRALLNYKRLTTEYPTSTLYYKALNNRGTLEHELKMYEQAKQSFLEILGSDVDDKEEVRVGYGLMAEPYANYRNRAAEMLYEIEFKQGNYQQAKEYLEESTRHKYYHWCGNAHQEKRFWLAIQRSKVESKLGNDEQATKFIIPHLFNRTIMKDQEIAEHCLKLLFRMKTREQLIEAFNVGIDNFYTRKVRPDSNSLDYFINFLGEELEVDVYASGNRAEALQLVREKVTNQWIYYLIQSKEE